MIGTDSISIKINMTMAMNKFVTCRRTLKQPVIYIWRQVDFFGLIELNLLVLFFYVLAKVKT